MENSKSLQSKVALVTGVGRKEGIGMAICRELAKNGADIFFTYWHPYDQETHPDSENNMQALSTDLEQLGVKVKSREVDLSQPDSAERLFEEVEKKLGTPSVLVNNACHDFEVDFTELSPEILD
ncbi:MAG: SDR family NAD(P)-dependent oxidoreductase [Candidatus Moraniibacteriota bacterium]|nr:MAG: SDR family NAD(P)-dependent oxidoreductase [Candidatus Moranbacteria bacterium]